ncbi:EpsD family peptidyl-prolyl cis-trans isomerase [Duganella guangzhouensis]|uniref:EpsD family peptidyl-prolyl cis-trans isomerase n=1 Tax=Duganella guangzhouensis TaxID=2666084 RepID=UPI0035306C2C
MLKPRQARIVGPLLLLALLSACGESKEKKPGQSLARVNGEEITVLQLNEELQRARVPAQQQETATQQLLESLIDRQLLLSAAAKDKLDRDPKVLQAIERAKAVIVAQAYLQKVVGTPAQPTTQEVADYYEKNPQLFAKRKQFDTRQLMLETASLDDAAKAAVDSAKSLDDVAAWLDSHHVKYGRNAVQRSSTDLPPQLVSKLEQMSKGQLFIVREGANSVIVALNDVKDAPLSLEAAGPQIQQFLSNKRSKDLADAEIKRLRAAGQIEYLNRKPGEAAPAASAPAASTAVTPAAGDGATERGVAGLK